MEAPPPPEVRMSEGQGQQAEAQAEAEAQGQPPAVRMKDLVASLAHVERHRAGEASALIVAQSAHQADALEHTAAAVAAERRMAASAWLATKEGRTAAALPAAAARGDVRADTYLAAALQVCQEGWRARARTHMCPCRVCPCSCSFASARRCS